LKFEPDAEIGQISPNFEMGRFAKVSQGQRWHHDGTLYRKAGENPDHRGRVLEKREEDI